MNKQVGLGLLGLLILSLITGYVSTVAGDVLDNSIRFMIQFITLILAVGLVICLLAFGWMAFEKSRTVSEQRLAAQAMRLRAEAEALKANLEASLKITVAPADHQVIVHEMGQSISHRALHLSPGRLNGVEIPASLAEQQRWAMFHMAHATARAAGAVAAPAPPVLAEGEKAPGELPGLIRWFEVIPGQRGNLNQLVLGLRINEVGQLVPVTSSLYDLFHTIAAASSGWGKSAFARSILAQLATCPQPTQFVLIDQQEHGLAPFKACARLRYPLLREPGEILSALREIYEEATRRRSELFARYEADDLEEYNQLAEDFLPPIIVAVDEASALLAGDKEIAAELKRQAWELRKFGVYQILCMTSAKGTAIDTDHRQQFSSKIQMHANDRYQARLLLDAPEAVTFPQGRAVMDLPGQAPMVVQMPYIDKREIRSLLHLSSTPLPPPTPPSVELIAADSISPEDNTERVIDLYDRGENITSICRQIFGYKNQAKLEEIKRILREQGRLG